MGFKSHFSPACTLHIGNAAGLTQWTFAPLEVLRGSMLAGRNNLANDGENFKRIDVFMLVVNNKLLIAGAFVGLILTLVLTALNMVPQETYAQNEFTLTTDKSKYAFGEIVAISGNVGNIQQGERLAVGFFSNSGKSNEINNDVLVENDGSFLQEFTLEDVDEGNYTVFAGYA